jgi:hypothetical protein
MWHTMREEIVEQFPDAPGLPVDATAYVKAV